MTGAAFAAEVLRRREAAGAVEVAAAEAEWCRLHDAFMESIGLPQPEDYPKRMTLYSLSAQGVAKQEAYMREHMPERWWRLLGLDMDVGGVLIPPEVLT